MDNSDYNNFMESYDVFDNPSFTFNDEIKVNSVYKLLVPLMELGFLNKFYIPPLMDSNKNTYKDLSWNQELFEKKMSEKLNMRPGKVSLDIGCGKGLISETVQKHSGGKVVGINISPDQLIKSKNNAK